MLDSIAVISHEMVSKIPVERITFGQRALTLLRATNRVLVTLESEAFSDDAIVQIKKKKKIADILGGWLGCNGWDVPETNASSIFKRFSKAAASRSWMLMVDLWMATALLGL